MTRRVRHRLRAPLPILLILLAASISVAAAPASAGTRQSDADGLDCTLGELGDGEEAISALLRLASRTTGFGSVVLVLGGCALLLTGSGSSTPRAPPMRSGSGQRGELLHGRVSPAVAG